jgi:uncharacterized protein YjiS (DUF1127 family)
MSTALASLGMALRRLLDQLAAIDAELRLRADLRRLDERTLRDVGLSRDEIDAEARRYPRRGRWGAFGPRNERGDGWRDAGRRSGSDETKRPSS